MQHDSSMECQNPGPWHLGISDDACKSALGQWQRSPCITLKECIDSRPANGTDHYSKAFEEYFGSDLVIDDPSDEGRCGEVREKLGFDPEHPFDTEVCNTFNEVMCDSMYLELDDILDGIKSREGATIAYEEAE